MSKYLYTIELERWVKMPQKKYEELKKKHKGTGTSIGDEEAHKSHMHVVAEDIEQVWDFLEQDRLDESVNILDIRREVPVLVDLTEKTNEAIEKAGGER